MLRYLYEQLGILVWIIVGYAVPVLGLALILSLASCVLGLGGHQVEY